MQNNTVTTLIDYVKDLTGLTNATNAKIIRALNFGTDHLSLLKTMAGSRADWDSSNHGDISRVTTTTSDSTLDLENELVTVKKLELVGSNGEYKTIEPTDRRYDGYESIKNATGTPTHYDIVGNTVRLMPTPDQSFTYRLTFGRVHPRYSVDNLTQATGLSPLDEEYVALYAADRLMIGANDPSRVAIRQELQIKKDEVIMVETKKDQSSARRMRPMQMAAFSNRNNYKAN